MDAVKSIDLKTTCCTELCLNHINLGKQTPPKCQKLSGGSYRKFWGPISQNPRNRNRFYLGSELAGVNAIVLKSFIGICQPQYSILGLEFF
jgi:hypothetical protein